MKEFTGKTYEEWLDYHSKVSYREIVKHLIVNFSHLMNYGFVKKES